MRFSNIFYKLSKDAPKEFEYRSQKYLFRACYIRQLASGIFIYLHFGQRSLKKIEEIIKEEMNAIGGDEICMPIVHPADIWKQTNRWFEIDQSMVRFKDRSERDMVLAMTHEEVVASLCAKDIASYKQLPKLVYQVYTKFRDEARSRGGLIRVREFTMKDSYSLDKDYQGLEKQYIRHYESYFRIFLRAGLPSIAVKSDTGMMGGKIAHEFMYVTPIGEDTLFVSSDGKYKANKEVATFNKQKEYHRDTDLSPEMEKIYTPNKKTIDEVAACLNVPADKIAKAILYKIRKNKVTELVMVIVRGDMEVNLTSLQKILKTDIIEFANEADAVGIGSSHGFLGPVGIDRSRCTVIVDDIIKESGFFTYGSNEIDYHTSHVLYGRDYDADIVADIVSAFDGATSPLSDAKIHSVRGVELGNIFQLGSKYTEAMNAYFTDEDGARKPIIMGSYGIGVGRMLGCLAEEYNDEKGLNLPISIAPYHVVLIVLSDETETRDIAENIYARMVSEKIEVLFDDRPLKHASAGEKFADADLIGIPIRLTISPKSIRNGGVELKLRSSSEIKILDVDNLVQSIKSEISFLFNEIENKVKFAEKWQ